MTLYKPDFDRMYDDERQSFDALVHYGRLVPVEPDDEAKDALDLIDAYLSIVRNILGVGEETP